MTISPEFLGGPKRSQTNGLVQRAAGIRFWQFPEITPASSPAGVSTCPKACQHIAQLPYRTLSLPTFAVDSLEIPEVDACFQGDLLDDLN